jgi:hypothetical protein
MGWIQEHIELGVIKPHTTHNIEFKWEGKVPGDFAIIEMKSSCGCTTPSFDRKTGTLKAVYKAGRIPKHLTSKGEVTSGKSVTLTTNKGDFRLTFKAIIRI